MRLGAAITIGGVLYAALEASPHYQTVAIDALSAPDTYSDPSREHLQLILATLDRLIPSTPATLRSGYQRVRAVVAAARDARPAPQGVRTVTYQPLGPPSFPPSPHATIVSTTGGFAVDIGAGAVAKRIDVRQPNGTVLSQHWIELQDGDTQFQAACIDGQTEATLVANFSSMGATADASKLPGHWMHVDNQGSPDRMRILSIAGRGCVASAEGPAGDVSPARVEAFLASLRASP